MNFDNWEYRESELPKDPREKELFLASLKEKFLKEVQANEKVQAWLQQFGEDNRESFLRGYARHKARLVEYSSLHIR